MAKWLSEKQHIQSVERYLDIGCNNGSVTLALAQTMASPPAFVIGVDVDQSLIRKAQQEAWQEGFQRPASIEQQRREERLAGSIGAGHMKRSHSQPQKRLAIIENGTSAKVGAFYTCDWTYADVNGLGTRLSKEAVRIQDKKGYDLVTALSVTKWIHLAHSDAGLRRFFARLASVLRPGGVLILEPQPFKSYRSLHKVTAPDSQERANWTAMRVMPDDFPFLLSVELGLEGPVYIQERGSDGFLRDLQAYTQPKVDRLSTAQLAIRSQHLTRVQVDNPLLPTHSDHVSWVSRDRKTAR